MAFEPDHTRDPNPWADRPADMGDRSAARAGPSGPGLSGGFDADALPFEDQFADQFEDQFPALIARLDRLGDQPVPSGVVDRVYAVSVAMLPTPVRVGVGNGDDSDGQVNAAPWSFTHFAARWAPRLAMAASIGLALVVASPFATVLHRGGVERFAGDSSLMPAMFAHATSAAEPMLVALLCDGSGGSRTCWLDVLDDDSVEQDFLADAGPELESLLKARGARFDDLAAEFGRILSDSDFDGAGGSR